LRESQYFQKGKKNKAQPSNAMKLRSEACPAEQVTMQRSTFVGERKEREFIGGR